MKQDKTYTIGEFSKKTGVSISTLHYYDELGLLVPMKHPTTGHRKYDYQDIVTLQKIVSLKFLGYQLEDIKRLLGEKTFTTDLIETLNLHFRALEEEKEKIERSTVAIRQAIELLEQEKEVDSSIFIGLIRDFHTEGKQNEWLEQHDLDNVSDSLGKRTEEEMMAFNHSYLQLTNRLKKLYGKPVESMEVQSLVKEYLHTCFTFLGDELIQQLADAQVDESDIQELEEMVPSPFTENEQTWLNEAMEYYMTQVEKEVEG